MDKKSFISLVEKSIVILDGATGTELSYRGMPKGVCPEKWSLEHKDLVLEIQKEYCKAGSQILYTPTFGGNRFKLEDFGLEKEVYSLNKELAMVTKEACENGFAFGSLAPTGKFVEPFGDVTFEEAVDVYKEQVRALIDGGVDGFIIETMLDIQETRAALIACLELSNMPVMVSMTFEKSGLTLNGTDPITALNILQSLGASAVGCNCSTGPADMIGFIQEMKPYAKVPLFAKPNAGMPVLRDGKTVFDMEPDDFASYMPKFIDAGVNLIGGCCGTRPEHIKKLTNTAKDKQGKQILKDVPSMLSSSRSTVIPGIENPLTIIGEKINPSGKEAMIKELQQGDLSIVKNLARQQEQQGAHVIDINLVGPKIDELQIMKKLVSFSAQNLKTPVCIDSMNSGTMEKVVRLYPGKAIINSISLKKKSIEALMPIAAKYGSMVILMPITDSGLPTTFLERKKVITELIDTATANGISKHNIIIDAMLLTLGTEENSSQVTLEIIEWISNELNMLSVCGISNLTYGFPERKWLNSTFLTMAVSKGLSMAFIDTECEEIMAIAAATDALTGRDKKIIRYIEKFSNVEKTSEKDESEKLPEELVFDSVLKGDDEKITGYIQSALDKGITPQSLVDEKLIPAINKVGDKFDKKEYFLPQLIMSADAMRKGFDILEPMLAVDPNNMDNKKAPTVVIATVQGDIHDIGKNIVSLMLKNYSFNVIDMGKDVSAEDIIRVAKHEHADIIGLSALMTTTMVEMQEVIDLAQKENLNVKFMIGGAVVDQNYANEIGAHGYAKDAMEAVRLAKDLSDNIKEQID